MWLKSDWSLSSALHFDAKDATNKCFAETKSTKKISWLTYSCEIKWSSLPWNGSWGRHADTNALRDDLKDNCTWDHDFAVNYQKKKNHNTHTDTLRILRYESIIDKVSLKLHKASSKTFCLDTVNFFFYSPSNEKANFPCQFSPSVHNSTVISRVTNQYLKWLFSYSNHPSSFKT